MTSALSGAGGGPTATPPEAALGVARVPERTAFHTSFWFCATAACSRTLGCTIVLACPNSELAPVQRQRFRTDWHNPVLANNPVLFSPAHQLARQQQKRPFAAVDQDKLVYARAGVLRHGHRPPVPRPGQTCRPLLADNHLSARESFIQCQKRRSVLRHRT